MNKRVLIFSTAYFPYIGGAEVAVREITNRINDVEFVMITARLDKNLPVKEKVGNIEVYRVGKGSKWDKFRLILQGPGIASKLGKFDLVWSIMASYAGFASLRYKKKNKTVPFLLTLQEGDTKAHIYKRVWFVWPYFKQIFKRADKIQAISNYLADWAQDLGAKCPIKVIPNGVDIQKFKEYSDKHIKGKDCSHKLIVTVSRLVEKNGVEHLIRSLEFLPEDIHLLIVGGGELESSLKNLVKEKSFEKRVHFTGKVSSDRVLNYLKNSDVFCRPSLSEGLGNAFLEAMAVGLPVVATKVGGIPDFLTDEETSLPGQSSLKLRLVNSTPKAKTSLPGESRLSREKTSLPGEARKAKTGWYAQVKNPQSIAEKIKYILDDKNKEVVDSVVVSAKKMVEEKYNWNLIAQKMNRIFLELP